VTVQRETSTKDTVRVAAIGDLHVGRMTAGGGSRVLPSLPSGADILALCGDLTDRGTEEEARLLAKELAVVGVPVVAVLGNHDVESGLEARVSQILTDAGVHVLDGESVEVHGIGFAGVKGFCGGFGRGTLGAWGERGVKAFVQEAMDEALKLERALAVLRTPHRVALLHYAPIRATVEGEPVEIFPWLGSGRLEEPLGRYPVDVVFHGHAHNGTAAGKTAGQIPVYNVSLPLLQRKGGDNPPYTVATFRRGEPGLASLE
jgi:Icc-related predicted phosphoesterase